MTPAIEKRIKFVNEGQIPTGYKKTKVGIIPKEWAINRLSEYLVINNEKNRKNKYTINNVFSVSGEYGVVNQIEFMGRSYAGESLSGYHVVYPNDIIYTKSPLKNNPFGIIKANLTGEIGIVSILYSVYHCKNNIIPYYVQSFFNSNVNLSNYLKPLVHIGPKHNMLISDAHVLDGLVPFPPLAEQKKIAEILSVQDKIIELKEKLIVEKQYQKKYLMYLLLGEKTNKKKFMLNNVEIDKTCWKKTKVKNLYQDIVTGATPSTKNVKYWNGEIPWMSSGEINKKIVYETNVKITQLGYDSCSTKLVPAKCVLIALAGQGKTRGTVAVNEISLCTNQSLATIIPKNADYKYLFYYLDSKYSDLRTISSGEGQRGGLNLDIISNYEVLLPSLSEQRAIAEVLSSVDEDISLLQKDLEQEKLKKKSLMQLLLTGIVRVKNLQESHK